MTPTFYLAVVIYLGGGQCDATVVCASDDAPNCEVWLDESCADLSPRACYESSVWVNNHVVDALGCDEDFTEIDIDRRF